MCKKELLEIINAIPDDNGIVVFRDDYTQMEDGKVELETWKPKEKQHLSIYQKFIEAIENGIEFNYQSIAEVINGENNSYLHDYGFVKVKKFKRGDKDYLRICKEDLDKNDELYKGDFEMQDFSDYAVIQHCQFEDDFYGQMLLPFKGKDSDEWLCVFYQC